MTGSLRDIFSQTGKAGEQPKGYSPTGHSSTTADNFFSSSDSGSHRSA